MIHLWDFSAQNPRSLIPNILLHIKHLSPIFQAKWDFDTFFEKKTFSRRQSMPVKFSRKQSKPNTWRLFDDDTTIRLNHNLCLTILSNLQGLLDRSEELLALLLWQVGDISSGLTRKHRQIQG